MSFLAATAIVFWSGHTTLAELIALLFLGLPLYSWIFAAQRGYMNRVAAYVSGALFLAAWILLQHWGHWVLSSASPTKASMHAPFVEWFVLCAVAVYAFCGVCWLFGSAEGRKMINRSWWLITFVLAEFCLSYYSSFGVTAHQPHPLVFPYDTLWALLIGLICFYWAVASGFETDEIRAITATGSGLVPEEEEVS